jgi:hypothetical protein
VLLHYSRKNPHRGREAVRGFIIKYREAFPDLEFRVIDEPASVRRPPPVQIHSPLPRQGRRFSRLVRHAMALEDGILGSDTPKGPISLMSPRSMR